ncbi:hypothetical protein O3M35_001361 [Rhynocoris fuscipes]|uniref:Trafficking kinesin-binding protein milt n=1 Tax=Rhynocoris fuscipes TaxID=488301 RepID=A0AAW1DQN0_9HEMI
MTKTYDDIEAVTRLLEEKEKDIELTARIGKELLSHNTKLETTIATLETELRNCQDKITQLSHELLKKNELLQILTNDIDEPSSEAGTPTGVRSVPFELLQKRITNLEDENSHLRREASRLAEATESCEEAEARLVNDLVSQLESVRLELAAANLDGERFKTRESELKEQVDHLLAKLQATDERLAQVLKENEEYITLINISRETQCELATELADLKERYTETQNLLQELQSNARKANKQSKSMARAGPLFPYLHTTQAPTRNSIAAELECSLFSELSLDSGLGASTTAYIPNYKKVFETVRSASRSNSVGSSECISNTASPGGIPAPRLGGTVTSGSFTSVPLRPRTSTLIGQPIDSPAFTDLDDFTPTSSDSGGGDAPSTTEEQLEAALKRLTPAAVDARRAAFSESVFGQHHHDCHTPDSIMSAGTNVSYAPWKLPDKLQIVKPLEGSATLHHWSELATPSMDGLLEERPGVKIRGGTELEHLGIQMYSLSDIEEDEEIHPGKSFCDTNHVFTFTNSTVLHPDDNTSVTASVRGSQMSSVVSSRLSSACSTPRARSRRNSTSTVSTTPSLARLLAERGIKAVTPSALGTPAYSPTATPCNSPDRPSSPVQEDEEDQHSALGLPGFLMSSGAELIWKTLGNALKSSSTQKPKALLRPDNKAALSGIRLVERIERIGLEEILTPSSSTRSLNGHTSAGGGVGPIEPGSPRTLHRAELRRTVRSQELGPGVLGVPGRPGTSSLENRLAYIPTSGNSSGSSNTSSSTSPPRSVRPDLGSVPSPPGLKNSQQRTHDSLGTLSAIFFGRKGGLL